MSSLLRPRLERLRKSLRHWQMCSNEYEALRREFSSLSPKAQREDMLEVGLKVKRKVIDEKEVKNLLGDELGIKRTVIQVITEITHRLDTAEENVTKFEEQIEAAQNEIDPDEEDEEDEYEPVDNAKYQPTAEGLATPEVQKELEEFRKRIHERGEASRAEAAKVAAEQDQQNSKKKRRGEGVRFAQEPDEEELVEKHSADAKDPTKTDSESGNKPDLVGSPTSPVKPDKLGSVVPNSVGKTESVVKADSVDKAASLGEGTSSSRKHASDTEDEYSKSESSTAEGECQPPKRVMLTTVTRSMKSSNPPDSSTHKD